MISNFSLLEEIPLEQFLLPEKPFKINGSIARYGGAIWCAYRTGNLHDFDAGNYLTEFDSRFNPLSHRPLIAQNRNTAFEDVRLFTYLGSLFAIYTYYPIDQKAGWKKEYGVGLGVIDVHTGLIEQQQSLRSYSNNLHSKNWIPCISGKEFFLVTDFDPELIILRADGEIGELVFKEFHRVKTDLTEWSFGQIRGSTPFIDGPGDGWSYCFVHSHIELPCGLGSIRYYCFTVLRLHLETKQVQYSKQPLGFSKSEQSNSYHNGWLSATGNIPIKVAFPMGIISYQNGVIISYGKDDYVTRMQFYSWDFLTECLKNA